MKTYSFINKCRGGALPHPYGNIGIKKVFMNEYLEKIEDLCRGAIVRAKLREERLVKPPHSLGVLEDIAIKVCGISAVDAPYLPKKRILVFAGDNGVVEEKVSCSPKSITYEQCINLTRGLTGCSTMARCQNYDLAVYDVGVDFDFNEFYKCSEYYNNYKNDIKMHPFMSKRVYDCKINYGTKNILHFDAMSVDDCMKAISVGISAVEEAKKDGIDIIGIGEMGIGNTTTSSALLSYITGADVEQVTGRGGGLLDEGLSRKIRVIKSSIERFESSGIKRDLSFENIISAMAALGGYDIVAMVGAFIASASMKMPVVIDGFISIVAAMISTYLCPKSALYMFASHKSVEKGYNIALDSINKLLERDIDLDIVKLKPLFDLSMRLGEGSGCIPAFQIIDTALFMHNEMKTFDEVHIDDSYLENIRKEKY